MTESKTDSNDVEHLIRDAMSHYEELSDGAFIAAVSDYVALALDTTPEDARDMVIDFWASQHGN